MSGSGVRTVRYPDVYACSQTPLWKQFPMTCLYTSRVYGNPNFSLQPPCASAQTIDMTASISGVASSRTPYGMQRTSISGFRAVFLAPCSSGLSIGQPIPPVLRERISFAATAVKFHVSANHASLSYPASLLPSMVS